MQVHIIPLVEIVVCNSSSKHFFELCSLELSLLSSFSLLLFKSNLSSFIWTAVFAKMLSYVYMTSSILLYSLIQFSAVKQITSKSTDFCYPETMGFFWTSYLVLKFGNVCRPIVFYSILFSAAFLMSITKAYFYTFYFFENIIQ